MLNVMGTHFIKHAKLSQVTSIIAEEVDKGSGEQPEDMEKVRIDWTSIFGVILILSMISWSLSGTQETSKVPLQVVWTESVV